MPVQKTCTILPRTEDQEEYKRLKAVLGIHNKDFAKLCLLANAALYDWFAGRPISQPTEAKILHAIKELQKRESRANKSPSNASQIDEASNQAVQEPAAETESSNPPEEVVAPPAPLAAPIPASPEPEDFKYVQTQPKWIAALRKLADTVDPMTTAVQNLELRAAVLEGRAAEAAETSANLREDLAAWVNHTGATLRGHHISMDQLERGQERCVVTTDESIGVIQEQLNGLRDASIRLACIEAEVNNLAKSLNAYDAGLELVGHRMDSFSESIQNILEENTDIRKSQVEVELNMFGQRLDSFSERLELIEEAEPDITDEQLERIQFNPPRNQAAKANLCVELLTPMSPVLISCIWEVVKANRLLAQAVAK